MLTQVSLNSSIMFLAFQTLGKLSHHARSDIKPLSWYSHPQTLVDSLIILLRNVLPDVTNLQACGNFQFQLQSETIAAAWWLPCDGSTH